MEQENNLSDVAAKAVARLQLRLRENVGNYLTLGDWLSGLSLFDVHDLNKVAAQVQHHVTEAAAEDQAGRDMIVLTMMLLAAEGEDVEDLTNDYVNEAMEYLTAILLPLEELRRAGLVTISYENLSFAHREGVNLTQLVSA
jgi:hypothetical protein